MKKNNFTKEELKQKLDIIAVDMAMLRNTIEQASITDTMSNRAEIMVAEATLAKLYELKNKLMLELATLEREQ